MLRIVEDLRVGFGTTAPGVGDRAGFRDPVFVFGEEGRASLREALYGGAVRGLVSARTPGTDSKYGECDDDEGMWSHVFSLRRGT
jgi:hypothetical protein